MTEIRRAAIITGGAGSIGAATAASLLHHRFDIHLVDRNAQALDAVKESLSGHCLTTAADVTQEADIARVVQQTLAAYGRIDALVNIAGGAGPKRANTIEETETATWTQVMDLNVTSAFLSARAVVPIMRKQRYGRIILLSSIIAYGEKGPPTTVTARLPYATAKAALLGLNAQLAKDLAADGITVNALLPGLILGEQGTRIADRFAALPADVRARMLSGYPIGRPGTGDEVAQAIAFLCSEGAAFISGVALPVDGAFL